jgi:hypothetical protein
MLSFLLKAAVVTDVDRQGLACGVELQERRLLLLGARTKEQGQRQQRETAGHQACAAAWSASLAFPTNAAKTASS